MEKKERLLLVQSPIIIIGMHRSGTSCLAGSLQQAGLRLGDVHTHNPFNRKGNREHPALMALHEGVLSDNGGSWHTPPRKVLWSSARIKERDEVIRAIAGRRPWGFKDPRALLVLDGWRERFPEVRFVGTLRHPLAVAESLHRRNPELGTMSGWLALWATYNQRLLSLWRERRFPIVDFDLEEDAYTASLAAVQHRLGLRERWPQRWRRLGWRGLLPVGRDNQAPAPFFDPALRSQRREGEAGLPDEVAELYRTLKEVARSSVPERPDTEKYA